MTPRSPGGHIDPLAGGATPLPAGKRPASGPISVLPEPKDIFVDAVASAGGTVEPLSPQTRGIIWLSTDPGELPHILRSNPGIGWVQLPWAGVDSFADVLAEFSNSPLPIWTSAKSAYSEPVAEHALALTLAILRGLPEKARSHSWAPRREGLSLFGLNVVIIGAGGVALELVRLLQPFDTNITVVRRSPGEVPGTSRTVTADRLMEVLPDADVVVVAAAATDATAHLIGTPQLDVMKPTAALVNIARGSLVDSDAVAAALNAGHLSGAGLDVTDPEPLPDGHPLWSAPRCVITSHSADTPEMTEPLLAGRVRANVAAFLGDGAFLGVVDPAAGY